MYKKSGGFIGYNAPRINAGRVPTGVYTLNDQWDARKGLLNHPKESIDTFGWEERSDALSDDPASNRVSAGFGDPEFMYVSTSDETDAWTEQVEWPLIGRNDYYGHTITTFIHPANRFYSRRFSEYHGSYMDVEHNNNQNFGTGPFTVEFWFRRTSTDGQDHYIISKGSNTGPTGWSVWFTSAYQMNINIAGTNLTTTLPGTGTNGFHAGLMRDNWYHVAIVREGSGTNQTKIYINGQLNVQGTLSGNATPTGQNLMHVGADRDRTSGSTRGQYHLTDLRVSNVAVYTSNFACVANVLTNTANTVFMLPMDSDLVGHGEAGSNLAPGGANITVGNMVMYETETPFHHTRPANVAATWFNSNADYLVTNTASTDYVVGASEFTFETWFYATTYGANITPIMVSQHGGGANAGQIIGIYQNYLGNGPAVIYPNNAGTGNVIVQGIGDSLVHSNANHRANSVTTATWHHMAITRDSSNTLRVFLDGNLKHANAGVTFNQSHQNRIWINTDPIGGRGMYQGWIADSHIANVCLYTGNFTPNVTVAPTRTANTLFALRGNVSLDWANAAGRGANLATTVALDNHTTIGTGRVVSLCRQDGGMSPYKADPMRPLIPDGLYDTEIVEERGLLSYQKYASIETETNGGSFGAIYQSLKSSDTSLQFGTGNFTFEVWVQPNNTGQYDDIFGCGSGSTGFSLKHGLTAAGSGNNRRVLFYHGSTEVSATHMPLTMHAWNHIAVVRQGTGTNQSNIFVNGYLAHTFTCATNITAASSPFYIGNNRVPGTTNTKRFQGRMCMLRLSNTARYTSTGALRNRVFTPPTTPFTSDANTRLLMLQHMGGAQTGYIDLGHHKMNARTGDFNYGMSTFNPATQVNWSWGEIDQSADLSIWNPDSSGVATNANGPSGDFAFGTGDFSFEWFYQPARRTNGWNDAKELFWTGQRNVYPDDDDFRILKDTNDNLTVSVGNGAGTWNEIKASSRTRLYDETEWYHCVIQRVNGNLAIYINGIREQEVRFTTDIVRGSYDSNIKFLGGSNVKDGFQYPVNGFVSNFRVFKGAAAYGKDGYNPLQIPVPNKPLDGEHPNCVFLTFCGPALIDYSRNNRWWGWGGHQLRWSAWDRVNDGSRSSYDLIPYGPFPEPVKHWRNHNSYVHYFSNAGLHLGDVAQPVAAYNINQRVSWIGGQSIPFTIEFYAWVLESGNNSATNVTKQSLLSTSAYDYTSGRGSSFEIEAHASSFSANYGDISFGYKDTGGTAITGNAGTQAFTPQGYTHIIWQYDPSATGAQKYVFWVDGKKKNVAYDNGGASGTYTTRGYHWNWIRGTIISDLRISDCARYNPLATRINDVYPTGVLTRDPTSYRRLDKHTAIHPTSHSPFRQFGHSPGRVHTMGAAAVSKAAPNTKLPGSRASIFLGQNSSQNSGGYWGSTTPPTGFVSPTTIRFDTTTQPSENSLSRIAAIHSDLTYEFWVSWAGSASPTEKNIFELQNNWSFQIVSAAGQSRFHWRAANSDTYRRSLGTILASSSSNRVYQHCVFQKRNSSWEFFIDGVFVSSMPATNWYSQWGANNTWTENITSMYFELGANADWTGSQCWLGNIMDPRLTVGVARYQRGIVNVNGTPTDGMVHAFTNIPVLAVHGGTYTTHYQANQYTST